MNNFSHDLEGNSDGGRAYLAAIKKAQTINKIEELNGLVDRNEISATQALHLLVTFCQDTEVDPMKVEKVDGSKKGHKPITRARAIEDASLLKGFLGLRSDGRHYPIDRIMLYLLQPTELEALGWIPVSNLPTKAQDGMLCIVLDPENQPAVWPAVWCWEHQHFASNGGWFEHHEVTHYMPLPPDPNLPEAL